jgi:hypothetical protein
MASCNDGFGFLLAEVPNMRFMLGDDASITVLKSVHKVTKLRNKAKSGTVSTVSTRQSGSLVPPTNLFTWNRSTYLLSTLSQGNAASIFLTFYIIKHDFEAQKNTGNLVRSSNKWSTVTTMNQMLPAQAPICQVTLKVQMLVFAFDGLIISSSLKGSALASMNLDLRPRGQQKGQASRWTCAPVAILPLLFLYPY